MCQMYSSGIKCKQIDNIGLVGNTVDIIIYHFIIIH